MDNEIVTGIKLFGIVEGVLTDVRTGRIKHHFKKNNLVVTAGAALIAQVFTSATGGTRPTAMGIGTSTTAPAAAQTSLQAGEVRRTLQSTSRSSNEITYVGSFGTGVGTGTIQEGGLFNATGVAAGTMLARFLTGSFTKGATDALTLTWKLRFGTM
jgi:hypothetical protein